VNESLSRALLRARLSQEDVASYLEVDPKTVRRWLDGRVPYLRHRWAIALLLGMDESDLWPQLQDARSQPGEVVAVYPHRDSVRPETWLHLLGSASREVGVLADSELLLADDSAIPRALAERARSGVRVRVCLASPASAVGPERADQGSAEAQHERIRDEVRPADLRIHEGRDYNSICYADGDLIVAQHVYGWPAWRAPTLRLRKAIGGDMFSVYLGSFDRIWAHARPLG
jgi:transcriptional regulator with XRE-family HTH domain